MAACDIVVCKTGVSFSLSELLFGLMPACVLPFVVRRTGVARAHYMTLMTSDERGRRRVHRGGALMDLSYWECQGLRSIGAMGSTRFAEAPLAAARPFDRDRDSFIFGESSAALVITSAEAAARCGSEPYARVAGLGVVSDANRNPSLEGEIAAIRQAIAAAERSASAIDYVNPHGTGSEHRRRDGGARPDGVRPGPRAGQHHQVDARSRPQRGGGDGAGRHGAADARGSAPSVPQPRRAHRTSAGLGRGDGGAPPGAGRAEPEHGLRGHQFGGLSAVDLRPSGSGRKELRSHRSPILLAAHLRRCRPRRPAPPKESHREHHRADGIHRSFHPRPGGRPPHGPGVSTPAVRQCVVAGTQHHRARRDALSLRRDAVPVGDAPLPRSSSTSLGQVRLAQGDPAAALGLLEWALTLCRARAGSSDRARSSQSADDRVRHRRH